MLRLYNTEYETYTELGYEIDNNLNAYISLYIKDLLLEYPDLSLRDLELLAGTVVEMACSEALMIRSSELHAKSRK